MAPAGQPVTNKGGEAGLQETVSVWGGTCPPQAFQRWLHRRRRSQTRL